MAPDIDWGLVLHTVGVIATAATAWRGARGRRGALREALNEVRIELADLRDEVGAVRARLNRIEDARQKANGLHIPSIQTGSDE